ncbi:MAG: DUF853 family protein [Actinomycetaceae bacterium]|nr:DUF853 family protein [Actinomycetaceae bacterium]
MADNVDPPVCPEVPVSDSDDEVAVAKALAEAAAAQAAAAQAKAEALEAEAKAAAAKAKAAQAAARASAAATQKTTNRAHPTIDLRTDTPATSPDASTDLHQAPAASSEIKTKDSAAPASDNDSTPEPTPQSSIIDTIIDGYTFEGPTLDIGALTIDGTAHPEAQIRLPLGMLNRHGLVAGATGTGKTRTLQLLTEELSANGVSVFLTDVKGDLSGLIIPGQSSEKLLERTQSIGQQWQGAGFPVEALTLGSEDKLMSGLPVRTTITNFGPILLARALDLNHTQTQALQLIFAWSDKRGLELIDLKDLRAVISYLTSDEGKPELKDIGGISTSTAGVILRTVSTLESQGGDVFFGEPAFETSDLLRKNDEGHGYISLLRLPELSSRPALVSTFVMWLLADLFHELPEVGDAEKPKLVFFFDEAHLLFKDASKEFLAQIVHTVKLIRSKGVGIIFVTQTPKDVPADVLGQLGARIQHALRAFTPDDAKALRATVSTFPTSPFDLEEVLTSLGTGEAVVTVLDKNGRPTPVAPTRLRAPAAVMGPAEEKDLAALIDSSALKDKYAQAVDNYSAYEELEEQHKEGVATGASASSPPGVSTHVPGDETQAEREKRQMQELEQTAYETDPYSYPDPRATDAKGSDTPITITPPTVEAPRGGDDGFFGSALGGMFGSMMRSMGTQLGREISREVFGTSSTRKRRSTKRRSSGHHR